MEEVPSNLHMNPSTSTQYKRQLETDEKVVDNSLITKNSKDLLPGQLSKSKKMKLECGSNSLECSKHDVITWSTSYSAVYKSNPASTATEAVKVNPNIKQIDHRFGQTVNSKNTSEARDKNNVNFVPRNTIKEKPNTEGNADKKCDRRESFAECETPQRVRSVCCVLS